jgi:hypothetical protein
MQNAGILIGKNGEKMTPVKGSLISISQFFSQTKETVVPTSPERVKAAAIPVMQNAPLMTPPRSQALQPQSPSVVPSPIQPMHPSHDARALLEKVPKRELRKFKGKEVHAVLITDTGVQHSKAFSRADVARHVSRSSKTLQFGTAPAVMEVEPGVELTVTAPDKVEIYDKVRKKRRHFGFHRHDKRKSPFPISGDGVIETRKGTLVSPKDLLDITSQYRDKPTGNPQHFLQSKVQSLSNS